MGNPKCDKHLTEEDYTRIRIIHDTGEPLVPEINCLVRDPISTW